MFRWLFQVLIAIQLLAGAALALPAVAQQPAGEAGGLTRFSPSSFETAPVVVDGTTIFRLRGASAFPARERAEEVITRIREVAADAAVDPASIRPRPHSLGLEIVAGQKPIVLLVDADAELEGLELGALAQVITTRIRQSIIAYREERSIAALQRKAAYAAAALVMTALLIAGFLFGTRWLMAVVNRRYKRHIEAVKIQSFRLVRAEQIYAVLRGFVQLLRSVFVIGMIYGCAVYVLGLFPWTRLAAHRLVDYLADPLQATLTAILDNVPNLFFIVIIYLITRVVLRLGSILFRAVEFGYVRFAGFEREWARPTFKLVRLGIIAFALVVAYPYIPGSDSAAFKGVSIFAGVILSLGSSTIISNIIAGYSMIYRRAYAVGDWIQVGGSIGEVVEQRLLVTHLRSYKNEAIVLPNSQILSSEVVNFSALAKQRGLLLHTIVGIGYEVPWRQVEAMLLEAARRTEGLRKDLPAFVLQKALGDFAITYELNVHCETPQAMPALYSALHRNILDVFNEHAVQIMTPNYRADPETPKLVPREHWYDPPAVAAPAKATE